MFKSKRFILTATITLLLGSACSESPKQEIPPPKSSNKTMNDIRTRVIDLVKTESKLASGIDIDKEPIKPLEQPTDLNAKKIELGKLLYHDNRLSKDNTISCASCHDLAKGGTDQTDVSTGVGGVKGPINSPTVFNSGFYLVQFWDGRAKDLAEQAAGPVHNPKEMGSNWDEVLGKLKDDAKYKPLFAELYTDGMTGNNIANAIAEFERSLVTLNSPFDKFLMGDASAISDKAKNGYEFFKGYGCTTCHNGATVGGNSFQKFGLVRDYFKDKGQITEADLGRFNVTKDESDKHKFKVPSLRVAPLTAPYFHDASAKTLDEAVRVMGRYQLGTELSDEEVSSIVAFLESLVGEYDGKNLLNP